MVFIVFISIWPIYKILRHLYFRISWYVIKNKIFTYSNSEEFLHEEEKIKNTLDYKIKESLRRDGETITHKERLEITEKGKKLMYKFAKIRIDLLLSYQCAKNRKELLTLLPNIKNKDLVEKVLIFISNRSFISKISWYLSRDPKP